MAVTGRVINGVVIGSPFRISRTVRGLLSGVTLLTARLQILASPTADPFVQTTVTPILGTFGQISDDGTSDGNAAFNFLLPEDDIKAAFLMTPSSGSNNQVTFEAVDVGSEGNDITVEYNVPLAANEVFSVSVTGTAITVNAATDGLGACTTTANDVVAGITASTEASALVTAVAVSPGSGVIATIPSQNLEGGMIGTGSFSPYTTYYYIIQYTSSVDDTYELLENGTFVAYAQNDFSSSQALTTLADAHRSSSQRINRIINNYADTILHDFRQLRVWDEQVRRSGADPYLLRLTYRNWNAAFTPEVINSQNELLSQSECSFDYVNGTTMVASDTGDEDFYVTYDFDALPHRDLEAMLQLTLMEVNLGGDGFVTSYSNVDDTPEYWDAPLTFGLVSKAFFRLATDSGLWRSYLIWAVPDSGIGLAKEAAAYYQGLFDKSIANIKRLHYIAAPTAAFRMFESVGFGNVGINSSRFRELRVNRVSTF